jgi:hypothetical protein
LSTLWRNVRIWACAGGGNRYFARFVFRLGTADLGVTSPRISATPPQTGRNTVLQARAPLISRSNHGCSKKQDHAFQAWHAPVA